MMGAHFGSSTRPPPIADGGQAQRRKRMFKHILVPVDGSNSSMLAVHKGVELAKAFGSTLTAVYVVDPYPFTGVGADFAYGQSQYLSAARSEEHTSELQAQSKLVC